MDTALNGLSTMKSSCGVERAAATVHDTQRTQCRSVHAWLRVHCIRDTHAQVCSSVRAGEYAHLYATVRDTYRRMHGVTKMCKHREYDKSIREESK